MKLIEKIRERRSKRPFFTLEFFPPRTDEVRTELQGGLQVAFDNFSSHSSLQGFANLLARISRLAALDPLAISITWGAGGSTRDRSLDLAEFTQGEYGIDTVMHLTCTNMEQGIVDDVLRVCVNYSHTERKPQRVAYNRKPRRGAFRTSLRFVVVCGRLLRWNGRIWHNISHST